MGGESLGGGFAQKDYEVHLDERKQLIDAARESARTFDQAVLAFGSAVFGFSIAFLKDIAPNPAPETLKWLGASWLLFSLGLLAILLSFLFSHRACMFQIKVGERALGGQEDKPTGNPWSKATNWCNIACVVLLFLGLLCWSTFALDNLKHGAAQMNKVQTPTEKKGYVPPAPPAKAPSQQQTPPSAPPATQPKK
jgi:hypothetical protein